MIGFVSTNRVDTHCTDLDRLAPANLTKMGPAVLPASEQARPIVLIGLASTELDQLLPASEKVQSIVIIGLASIELDRLVQVNLAEMRPAVLPVAEKHIRSFRLDWHKPIRLATTEMNRTGIY